MQAVKSIVALKSILTKHRRNGKRIGFVPTMGYFHEGHLDLMRQAKKDCDICVVSIYVNPTQFGPKEDLARYPRDLKRDTSLMRKENVDICFIPTDNQIYPEGYLTYVDVNEMTDVLCGAFRPGHFKGVLTIVNKLLNIVNPDVLYLGQKDAQQVAVIKRMISDLNMSVACVIVPTKREPDGLAMSSRNVYLTAEQRQQSVKLYQALCHIKVDIAKGQRKSSVIKARFQSIIKQSPLLRVQYIDCVDARTLRSLKTLQGDVLIAAAVFCGKTRLIDNCIVKINGSTKNKN